MPRANRRSNEDVFAMLDHLAWLRRANIFEGDFKTAVIAWFRENTTLNELSAQVEADVLWKLVNTIGLVETFQQHIEDEDVCRALVAGINS